MNSTKPRRPGLTEDDLRQAIAELVASEQKVTPTKVRELLGTGSFTTISRAIAAWKHEQETTPAVHVPDPPKCVARLLQQLWHQAWISAHASFDDERQRFAAAESAFAKERQEMLNEIGRLETENLELMNRIEECEGRLRQQQDELVDRDRNLANLRGQLESVKCELVMANQERQHAASQLTSWIERASRAETKLRELTRNLDAKRLGKETASPAN